MPSERVAVSLQIMNKPLQVGCLPEERDDLLAAAELVSSQLAPAAGKPGTDNERILMLCALNLANDLLRLQRDSGNAAAALLDNDLIERAEAALAQASQPLGR